jgi:hypothetical protein
MKELLSFYVTIELMKERYQISNKFWITILYGVLLLAAVLFLQYLTYSLLVTKYEFEHPWILMILTITPTVIVYLILLRALIKSRH